MSYFNKPQFNNFDPFVEYTDGQSLKREFVDYIIDLCLTGEKSKINLAYSYYKRIKPMKVSLIPDWWEEMDIHISEAYDKLNSND